MPFPSASFTRYLLPLLLPAAGTGSLAAAPPALVAPELQRISVADAPAEFGVKQYGALLQVSGDTAIFIGEGTPDSLFEQVVFVYVYQDGAWTFQQRILGTEAGIYSEFGHAIAIDGDTLVISASAEPKGEIDYAGCLLVYVRNNGVWSFQAKLQANDAAHGDFLGEGIAIHGDTILTLAHGDAANAGNNAGNAYFFHRQNGVWTQQGQLPTSPEMRWGNPYEELPLRVALHGDLAVVGAPLDNLPAGGTAAGRVYLFRRDNGVWTADGTLISQSPGAYDFFGTCVATDGETLMIGAVQSGGGPGEFGEGEVYVYQRDESGWSFTQSLADGTPERIDPTMRFGATLDVEGDTALIGGPGAGIDSLGSHAGSAFIFRRKGSEWKNLRRLLPEGSDNAGTAFGSSLALHGRDQMLIRSKEEDGTWSYDPNLNNRGVVLSLGLTETSGPEIRLIAATDNDGDEMLSEDEWNGMLPIAKSTFTLFDKLDSDASGILDYPELAAGTENPASPAIYRLWMDRLDAARELDLNQDLMLSRDELLPMWPPGQGKAVDAFIRRLNVTPPVFTYHWLRAKGVPSDSKYEAAKAARIQRGELAGELDTNEDGNISREEFAALFPATMAVAKIDTAWRAATATPKKGVAPAQITIPAFIEAPVLPKINR